MTTTSVLADAIEQEKPWGPLNLDAPINGVVGRHDDDDNDLRTYTDPVNPELVYPSVTTVLGATHALDHVLVPWSARMATQFVLDNREEFERRLADRDGWLSIKKNNAAMAKRVLEHGPEAATTWMYEQIRRDTISWAGGENKRVRDLKAEIGTHQHNILEALLLNAPIPDCPEHLVGIEIDGERVDHDAISDGLLNFLTDFDPQIEMAEATVCNTNHNYAGTADLAGWFPSIRIPGAKHKGARLLLDLFTGKVTPETKPAQAVAYKRATEVWVDHMGTKMDMPHTDMAGVIHLRRSYKGGYKVSLVRPEHEEFRWQQFLNALDLYKLQQDCKLKPMEVFYPPKGDGSQPLPMIEDISLDKFGRCRKPLMAAGIEKLDQLTAFTADEVESIKGIGEKSLDACRSVMARYQLAFAEEDVE